MNRQNKRNWLLYAVWIIVLVSTIIITRFYSLESLSFYGIADTREIVVNFEDAVEIKRINVTEGQSVKEGMLMVELGRPDLMLKMNQISHQLDRLKAQKGLDKVEILAKLNQLKAKKAAKENELQNQIEQLENQYNINKSLLSGLKSIPDNGRTAKSDGNSPIELKIRSLKEELSLSINPLTIQIELLKKNLVSGEDPIEIRVERLEKELAMLKAENSKLNIYAQIPGIIGSVNFKPGEMVPPFSPILTLYTKNPSFIKGYIYENAYADIGMGEEVDVASLAIANSTITGSVVGVGGRIVAYPMRLRKHPDLRIWGREVVIQIPAENPFILGEKVLITAADKRMGFTEYIKRVLTPSESIAAIVKNFKKICVGKNTFPVTPFETDSIEASALLYLDDIDRYMVLSDDTPGNAPLVMLMDADGQITRETVIRGLDKIDDMESVAQGDAGILYICSSLSANRKGRIKTSRKRLVSVERKGGDFSVAGMVDLYSMLNTHAIKERGAPWADFVSKGIEQGTLDMEGMMYKDGALFAGFKAPLMNEQSVILKIRNVDQAIKIQALDPGQVSIWRSVTLTRKKGQIQDSISGLLYHGGNIFFTGTPLIKTDGVRSGSLWKLDEETGEISKLANFENLQPEGISIGKDKNTLMICFDQGRKEKSELCVVKLD